MIPSRFQARLPAMAAVAILLLTGGCGNEAPKIHAKLVVPPAGYMLLNEPVVVSFDHPVKAAKTVTLSPAAEVEVQKQGHRLLLTPVGGWQPGTTYELLLKGIKSTDGGDLKTFKATFKTQPRHGVAGFLVSGRPVTGTASAAAGSHVTITFTDPVNTRTVTPMVNGQPVATEAYKWADDGRSVDVGVAQLPYQKYEFGVGGQPTAAGGDLLTDLATLILQALPLQPANASSGVTPGFKTIPPLQIAIDDSGPARPQSGFQRADMVFEYISEFGINRMTAMYFNQVADAVGPVRSCRTINAFLVFGYGGILMCSGVADGTQLYIPGGTIYGTKPAPGVVEDRNAGQYFYRSNLKSAPHNLYTNPQLAGSLRSTVTPSNDASASYVVDPPHPDNGLGQPAEPPAVPLQGITYSYSDAARAYLRFDRGTPSTEGNGPQLEVKNIVVMHTPFHYTEYSESGCCAYSVWYEMIGTGGAEIYSNGKLVRATWHMGTAGQSYMENTQPVWFTEDATGQLVELNTGLTWVHVVGNGQ